MTTPRVTIGLLTWNGAATLPACLASLLTQTFTDWELVALDNGSTDESATLVAAWCVEHLTPERWRLVQAKTNTGYAAGMNAIAGRSRGEFLLALNQDVALHPKFIEALVSVLDGYSDCGAVCGRVYRSESLTTDGLELARVHESDDNWRMGRTIDSTGHVLYRDRVVMNRRNGQNETALYGPDRDMVFGVPGSCPLYRRAALEDIRDRRGWIWDPRFFAYLEDVDLDYRFAEAGWTDWFYGGAVALHQPHGSGGRATFAIRFRAHMNRYRLMAKHETLASLLPDLGPILLQEAYQFVRTTFTNPLLHFSAIPFVFELLTGAYAGGRRWRREAVETRSRWDVRHDQT